MTHEPLEEVYFKWLAVQVVNTRLKNPALTNWRVLQQLFGTEFVWRIHNDENRVEDGKELRSEFLESHPNEQPTQSWLSEGCSFLEMLIALSRRLAFQTEGVSATQWFWQLLENAGLNLTDANYETNRMGMYVGQVLEMLNNRTYDSTGRGGLFPLHDAQVDQRRAELWHQMNYYLLERS